MSSGANSQSLDFSLASEYLGGEQIPYNKN